MNVRVHLLDSLKAFQLGTVEDQPEIHCLCGHWAVQVQSHATLSSGNPPHQQQEFGTAHIDRACCMLGIKMTCTRDTMCKVQRNMPTKAHLAKEVMCARC